MSDRPLVCVEWVDAESGPSGWESMADALAATPQRVRSVGWLLVREPDRIVLAAHLGQGAASDCGGRFVIPTPWVVRLVELHEPPPSA